MLTLPEQLDGISPRLQRSLRLLWVVGAVAAAGSQMAAIAGSFLNPLQTTSAIAVLPVAAASLAASALLIRRRPDEPVSMLLSFAFLLIATSILGPYFLWKEIGHAEVGDSLVLLWLYLLGIAFLAYPDGSFVPSWTRWAILAGPLALAAGWFSKRSGTLLLTLVLLLSVGALAVRFRRTPPGLQRQQIKWVAFGFTAGIPAVAIGFILLGFASRPSWGPYFALAGVVFVVAGFLLVPLGVIVSQLRYRLNDIDALMGRSSSFVVAAVLVACFSAVGLAATETVVTGMFATANQTWPKAVVALSAMAVFAPSQKRAMKWAEIRFRPAFARLQTLPGRLAQWQHGEDPTALAHGALTVIVDGIKAERGALVVDGDAGRRILALHEIPLDSADAVIPDTTAMAAALDGFPLVLDLTDENGRVGRILLGPRSDGASYRRDEREAVTLIVAPLADALRATTECERRNAALAVQIEQLNRRIAEVEALLAPTAIRRGRKGTASAAARPLE